MNPISIRLLNQQLIAPQFSKPEEVVAHFGAMQAQEYRMMRWAVGMRTKRPSEKAFTKAFNEGKIVRLHLFRGTWQLVNADDFWWMFDLYASKARQIVNGWMSSNRFREGLNISFFTKEHGNEELDVAINKYRMFKSI